ncbi:hypothetical protein O6H91_Y207100 [Diphasiastrum complanatum]|nr:hypothetical protein O6H91_Y207100 [Diphasiastrum complanatum]
MRRYCVTICCCALLMAFSPILGVESYVPSDTPPPYYDPGSHPDVAQGDIDVFNFALNLEYLEAELFLWASFGYGLDEIAPELPGGGPSPVGVEKAQLDNFTRDVVAQLGIQEVGHLRAIRATVTDAAISRPPLNLSVEVWAKIFDSAFGQDLNPPFNPYVNSLNFLLASYAIPYVGLTGYVGANPNLVGRTSKRLIAGLLGVEAGQDAIIRSLLYEKKDEKVTPYSYTVGDFTNALSKLRNRLDKASGIDDLGLTVHAPQTAAPGVHGSILSADTRWVAYSRTPEQILSIVYGTGNASKPGGFYPKGGNGDIARYYLN